MSTMRRIAAVPVVALHLSFVVLSCNLPVLVGSYEWSVAGHKPIDRRAIVGIWKLTSIVRPMKEFTVYPKKAIHEPQQPDVLLMLNEDGSFKKYAANELDNDEASETKDVDTSWSYYQRQQIQKQKEESYLGSFAKGTWEYQDGHLMLAAERNQDGTPLYQSLADGYPLTSSTTTTSAATTTTSTANYQDTLLKGRLVATNMPRLDDNPVLASTVATSTSSNATTLKGPIDTHLSVPKGSINVGKFIYPRNHPSFFDQPMFQPKKKGTFALRQILGNLNTGRDDDTEVEKFRRSDFYNKTFLLTAHPLGFRSDASAPQGEKRWSIKYNRFVYDPPSSKKVKEAAEEAKKRSTTGLRVLQITFHHNNTFSTTAGLGTSAILRGKFDVIGTEKDHLWMQVIRFGFGRSVSGSVYSEGPMLSHEDAKAYWGTIRRTEEVDVSSSRDADDTNTLASTDSDNEQPMSLLRQQQQQPIQLEVEGSVLDGWGLEPSPVARFIMRETSDTALLLEEEDDEDEVEEKNISLSDGLDDGVDWSSQDGNSFQ